VKSVSNIFDRITGKPCLLVLIRGFSLDLIYGNPIYGNPGTPYLIPWQESVLISEICV